MRANEYAGRIIKDKSINRWHNRYQGRLKKRDQFPQISLEQEYRPTLTPTAQRPIPPQEAMRRAPYQELFGKAVLEKAEPTIEEIKTMAKPLLDSPAANVAKELWKGIDMAFSATYVPFAEAVKLPFRKMAGATTEEAFATAISTIGRPFAISEKAKEAQETLEAKGKTFPQQMVEAGWPEWAAQAIGGSAELAPYFMNPKRITTALVESPAKLNRLRQISQEVAKTALQKSDTYTLRKMNQVIKDINQYRIKFEERLAGGLLRSERPITKELLQQGGAKFGKKMSKGLPIFKNTNEALAFGKKATPEQVRLLAEKRTSLLAESNKLQTAGKTQEAMDSAVQAQFMREAMEVAPKGKVMPSKIITDPAEVTKIEKSILQGQNMLRAGVDSAGEPLSVGRRMSIRKAILNAQAKIGKQLPIKEGYIIKDVTPAGYGPTPVKPPLKPPGAPPVRTEAPTGAGVASEAKILKEATYKLNPTELNPKKIGLYQRFKNNIENRWIRLREIVEDDLVRYKKLMQQPGLKITDATNRYDKEILYYGRVSYRLEGARETVKAIDKNVLTKARELKMRDADLIQDANKYLIAKHAPERNIIHGEGAAGITTKEARKVLAKVETLPTEAKTAIKEISQSIADLNKQVLEVLHEGGIITTERLNHLRKIYPNHVSLNRVFAETEDFMQALTGKGFSVKGTGLKRAVGSQREVADILTNTVANYEQAIIRAEKNIVDNALLGFVRDNKKQLSGLFDIRKAKRIGTNWAGFPIFERVDDPRVLHLFEKGKPIQIFIADKHMATALRGVNRQKLSGVLRYIQTFTRFYSGLATRFNPEFFLPNKIRDLQEMVAYMASKKDIGFKGATGAVSRDIGSVKDVVASVMGKDTPGARLYDELRRLGGTTGGLGLSTRAKIELDIAAIRKLNRSNPKKLAEYFVQKVDDWNTIFEDSTRLSVYKQALSQGVSKQRALVLAKEASINFNKFGTGGPVINAFYMFSNASIQGSAKMIRSLRNPKVAATIVSAVTVSTVTVNEWNDYIDPDWREKVPKWARLNGLAVVYPTKEGIGWFAIPVSWGIKPIKVAADSAYDLMAGKADVGDAASGITAAVLEGYNPLGGTDVISAITPTILDTPFEIWRNKAWTGSRIRPDWDKHAPADIQYFRRLKESATGKVFIGATEKLAEKGIEVSPANINYAYQSYIGGAGRFVSKVINTITSVGKGEAPALREIPFVSRFVKYRPGEMTGAGSQYVKEMSTLLSEQSRERFKLKNKAEEIYEELKQLPPEQANAEGNELKRNDPRLYERLKDIVKDEKLGLTYPDRMLKMLGVENGERAKFIWKRVQEKPTIEEKNAYISELQRKKIISSKVREQLKLLQKKAQQLQQQAGQGEYTGRLKINKYAGRIRRAQ